MTEYETKLLASLTAMSMQQHEQAQQQENQARQLTALALSQSQTTQALAKVSEQQAQISGVLMRLSEHQTSTWTLHEQHGQALSVLSGHQKTTSGLLTKLSDRLEDRGIQATESYLLLGEHQVGVMDTMLIIQQQQVSILNALSKEPEEGCITAMLEQLLKPLVAALNDLSRRLPPSPSG